jgi:serine/threonine protein kinase
MEEHQSQPIEHSNAKSHVETLGYKCKEKIGSGTYGEVWVALKGTSKYAIKLFHQKYVDPVTQSQELSILVAGNEHYGVIRVHGHNGAPRDGAPPEPPYCIMELLADENANGTHTPRTLKAKIDGKLGKWDQPTKMQVLRDLVDGMAFLHKKKIVHCDLKAENVLLTIENRAKIADFGQSRKVGNEVRYGTGTHVYASPEQLRRQECSEEGDVYSFGVLAWYLITGEYPRHDKQGNPRSRAVANGGDGVPGQTEPLDYLQPIDPLSETRAREVEAQSTLHWPPTATWLGKEERELLMNCLELDPRKRYKDMQNVQEEFRTIDENRKLRRRIRIMAGMGILSLAVIAFAGWVQIERTNVQETTYRHQIGYSFSQMTQGDYNASRRSLISTNPRLRNWEFGVLLSIIGFEPLQLSKEQVYLLDDPQIKPFGLRRKAEHLLAMNNLLQAYDTMQEELDSIPQDAGVPKNDLIDRKLQYRRSFAMRSLGMTESVESLVRTTYVKHQKEGLYAKWTHMGKELIVGSQNVSGIELCRFTIPGDYQHQIRAAQFSDDGTAIVILTAKISRSEEHGNAVVFIVPIDFNWPAQIQRNAGSLSYDPNGVISLEFQDGRDRMNLTNKEYFDLLSSSPFKGIERISLLSDSENYRFSDWNKQKLEGSHPLAVSRGDDGNATIAVDVWRPLSLKLWDVKRGTVSQTIIIRAKDSSFDPDAYQYEPPLTAAFSGDGSKVVVSFESNAWIYNTQTGALETTLNTSNFDLDRWDSWKFDPKKNFLLGLSSPSEGAVCGVFHTEDGSEVGSLSGPYEDAGWTPDGSYYLAKQDDEQVIRVWRRGELLPFRELPNNWLRPRGNVPLGSFDEFVRMIGGDRILINNTLYTYPAFDSVFSFPNDYLLSTSYQFIAFHPGDVGRQADREFRLTYELVPKNYGNFVERSLFNMIKFSVDPENSKFRFFQILNTRFGHILDSPQPTARLALTVWQAKKSEASK